MIKPVMLALFFAEQRIGTESFGVPHTLRSELTKLSNKISALKI
jgi:hypothetical protein